VKCVWSFPIIQRAVNASIGFGAVPFPGPFIAERRTRGTAYIIVRITVSKLQFSSRVISFVRYRAIRADTFPRQTVQYYSTSTAFHVPHQIASNSIRTWHVVIFRWSYSILHGFQLGTAGCDSRKWPIISCHENISSWASFRRSDGITSVAQADAGLCGLVCDVRISFVFSF
jgi:hypothetical protein